MTPTLVAHRLADYVRAARQNNPLLRISCLDCLQPVLLDALLESPHADWQVRCFQPRRRDVLQALARRT